MKILYRWNDKKFGRGVILELKIMDFILFSYFLYFLLFLIFFIWTYLLNEMEQLSNSSDRG